MILSGRLILASRSPRRLQLLKDLGLKVEVVPSEHVEERRPGLTPAEQVLYNAKAKAVAVLQAAAVMEKAAWVLGADTLVALGAEVMGKPKDGAEARKMLRSLSGKEHSVYTGYFLIHSKTESSGGQSVRTAVRFKTMSDPEINWYVESGEPLDKAGAYAIQGLGGAWVESINGSYSNVVGLPLCELLITMQRLGSIHY